MHHRARRLALPTLSAAVVVAATLAPLALAPAAPAAARKAPKQASRPALRLIVQPMYVPGFPRTGNHPRWGADLDLQLAVLPRAGETTTPPVTELKLYMPAGLRVQGATFPTCPASSLASPSACPRGSAAGPLGEALLSFPSALSGVQAVAEAFHAPDGGLELVTRSAATGAPLLLGAGTVQAPVGEGGQGPVIDWKLGPVAGSQMPTLESLHLQLGGAMHVKPLAPGDLRTVYFLTLPREAQCPLDGLHFAAVVRFAATQRARSFTIQGRDRPPCPSPPKVPLGPVAPVG